MSDWIDLKIFKGSSAEEIANNIDKTHIQDGGLSGIELSVFISKCEEKGIKIEEESWYGECADVFEKTKNMLPRFKPHEEVPDALRVEKPLAKFENNIQVSYQMLDNLTNSKPPKLTENSDIRFNDNYEYSEEDFNNIINSMLDAPRYGNKFKNSILRGKAKAFIDAGKRFNIDPRFIVAVSMCESARGTSSLAINNNNIGGLKNKNGYIKFSSVEASIDSVAKTINSRYTEGYQTIHDVAHSGRYCAGSVSENWLKSIKSYIQCFNRFYDAKQ